MRDFATIAPQFWTGNTGRALRKAGPDALLAAMYLLTTAHSNAFGLYYMPVMYMAHDLNLPLEKAEEAMGQCIAAGFCAYDDDTEVVWIFNMARFQIGESVNPRDNRAKWLAAEWQRLPKCKFLAEFAERYAVPYGLAESPYEGGAQASSEAPYKAPSEGGTEVPYEAPPPEQDQDKNKECVLNARSRIAKAVPEYRQPDIGFEQFFEAYPDEHRGGRQEAEEAWLGLARHHALPGWSKLMDALACWETSEAWRQQGGRYIPSCANFLSREYWLRKPPKELPPARAAPAPPVSAAERKAQKLAQDGEEALVARIKAREAMGNGKHGDSGSRVGGFVHALPAALPGQAGC